jgi:hypothetical protein
VPTLTTTSKLTASISGSNVVPKPGSLLLLAGTMRQRLLGR